MSDRYRHPWEIEPGPREGHGVAGSRKIPGGHNRTLSDSDHFLSSGVVLPTGKQKNSRIIIGRFLKLALDKQQKCLSFNSLKRAAKNSSI